MDEAVVAEREQLRARRLARRRRRRRRGGLARVRVHARVHARARRVLAGGCCGALGGRLVLAQSARRGWPNEGDRVCAAGVLLAEICASNTMTISVFSRYQVCTSILTHWGIVISLACSKIYFWNSFKAGNLWKPISKQRGNSICTRMIGR